MVGQSIEERDHQRARLWVNVERGGAVLASGLRAAAATTLRRLRFLAELVLGCPKRANELVAVAEELAHALVDLTCQLVDRDEERHLALFQRVDDVAVGLADLKDALTVGDKLHPGQMLFEPGALAQVFERAPHALKGHAALEQRVDDLERDEIAERVQPADARTASRRLYGRLDEPDLVPIAKLVAGTACEPPSLKRRESFHRLCP